MKRLRLLLVAALWLTLTRVTLDWGALLLPRSIAQRLSLEAFLTLAQLVTTAAGLGLAALALPSVRDALGLRRASGRALVVAVLGATPVFVIAMATGLAIALPTLLAELHRGGAAVSQQNVGELGHALEKASLAMTLAWATLAAPLAEEVLFRGAVWGAFQALVAPPIDEGHGPAIESLPPELLADGALVKAGRRVVVGLRSGGLATLASAAVFGAMHLGMAGGSGIVRVVSATCLGLACGTARHLGGSLALPIVLHVLYNLISVGHARGWFLSETFPAKFAMPTLVVLLGAISALALAAFALLTRPRAAVA